MAITRDGFAFYEEWFDRPYPFAKYDQLFVPEFNAGAMENAGCVTFVETYVFRSKPTGAVVERRAETILHELAHMWFGDLVTMRWWDDLWLNESFASYASVHAMAESTRWTSAWTTFAALEKSWAYRQDQLPSTHPIVADMVDLEAVEVNFDGITYAKGASVLKQLVAFVGQDAFTAGLRAYFAAHAWGNTTLDDFLAALEDASGRDLRAWSAVWLEQSGVTTLRPVFTTDETDTITSFSIAQDVPETNPVQRPHRLGIGFYSLAAHADGSPETLRRVWSTEVDVDGASTELDEVVGQSQPDLLLVNDEDLAYAKVRLDPESSRTAVQHVAQITDPLPRSLVLGTAWDMTRDAETSGRDFVDMVLADLAIETEPSVTTTLLRQMATTVSMYVTPGAARRRGRRGRRRAAAAGPGRRGRVRRPAAADQGAGRAGGLPRAAGRGGRALRGLFLVGGPGDRHRPALGAVGVPGGRRAARGGGRRRRAGARRHRGRAAGRGHRPGRGAHRGGQAGGVRRRGGPVRGGRAAQRGGRGDHRGVRPGGR